VIRQIGILAVTVDVQFLGDALAGRKFRDFVLSVFAGQRPLAAPKKEGKNTKEISRSHKIIVSDNGLVTITGGKWTSSGFLR